MALKQLIEEIEIDVTDVLKTGFDYVNTNSVPNRSDNQLTFERNIAKRGKILRSCVLYVDIRNSVNLTEKHNTETMGKIYTAFSKSVIKAAKHHSGHIRNIIGDRIMVIFPSENCFTKAVDCAITINHVAKYLINKAFKEVDFKCGIGIDYGDLRVIKVGVQRRGHEGTENKSLVWVGYPANIASRLTDMANKSISQTYYLVERNPINPRTFRSPVRYDTPLGRALGGGYDPKAPTYLSSTEQVEMSPEKFADSISQLSSGEIFTLGGKLVKFKKLTRLVKYPGILMTDSVYKGFKLSNPNRACILKNLWTEQAHDIKNVQGKIFGGDVIWAI